MYIRKQNSTTTSLKRPARVVKAAANRVGLGLKSCPTAQREIKVVQASNLVPMAFRSLQTSFRLTRNLISTPSPTLSGIPKRNITANMATLATFQVPKVQNEPNVSDRDNNRALCISVNGSTSYRNTIPKALKTERSSNQLSKLLRVKRPLRYLSLSVAKRSEFVMSYYSYIADGNR